MAPSTYWNNWSTDMRDMALSASVVKAPACGDRITLSSENSGEAVSGSCE